MGLFDQILSAVNDPNQQGSADQIGNVLNMAQQLGGNSGADPSMMPMMMSVVGNYVRSSLQEKRAHEGADQAQAIVNQFSGTTPNQGAVEALLSPVMQQQVVQDLMQRTGLNPQTIQMMLPMLIPMALKLLQSGNNTQNPQAGNSVLNTFLDGDNDGDVDLGDVMGMAGKFMNR